MARAIVADRKATRSEVASHAREIRAVAEELGLERVRVRDDGTVVAHSEEAGYRAVMLLSGAATNLVGTYVHVITDDVPGAADATEL